MLSVGYGFCKKQLNCLSTKTLYYSCGSSVYKWEADDLVNHRRWHLYGCALALGKDKTNKPVGTKPLKFIGDFATEIKSLDSGYESTSSSNSETNAKVGQHAATVSYFSYFFVTT